jgi:hypothetical protein
VTWNEFINLFSPLGLTERDGGVVTTLDSYSGVFGLKVLT